MASQSLEGYLRLEMSSYPSKSLGCKVETVHPAGKGALAKATRAAG